MSRKTRCWKGRQNKQIKYLVLHHKLDKFFFYILKVNKIPKLFNSTVKYKNLIKKLSFDYHHKTITKMRISKVYSFLVLSKFLFIYRSNQWSLVLICWTESMLSASSHNREALVIQAKCRATFLSNRIAYWYHSSRAPKPYRIE